MDMTKVDTLGPFALAFAEVIRVTGEYREDLDP